jgi:hypothetical protein
MTREELGLSTPPVSHTSEFDPAIKATLASLYSESTMAKIWGIAERALDKV